LQNFDEIPEISGLPMTDDIPEHTAGEANSSAARRYSFCRISLFHAR
jgi:hypothetical protein